MAEVLILEFRGDFKRELYDRVNRELGIDENGQGDWPAGLMSHSAGFVDGGFAVIEVWESKAQQEAFMNQRLGAALQAGGAPAPTRMEWLNLLQHKNLT